MLALLFLTFVGVLAPYGSVKGYLAETRPEPPPQFTHGRRSFRFVATLMIFTVFALVTAGTEGINLLSETPVSWAHVAAGAATVVVTLVLRSMLANWFLSDNRRSRSRLIPRTWATVPAWVAVSLAAGVCEEIIYRGVLTLVLLSLCHSLPLAAGLSALAFALVHINQGWRVGLFIFTLALALQWLVFWSGTLVVAMGVHALYDLLVGLSSVLANQGRLEATEPVEQEA